MSNLVTCRFLPLTNQIAPLEVAKSILWPEGTLFRILVFTGCHSLGISSTTNLLLYKLYPLTNSGLLN